MSEHVDWSEPEAPAPSAPAAVTPADAADAARLVAFGLQPKLQPARDQEYTELLRRYREDPPFARLTDAVAAGLGLVVLEAMASGLPVIASPAGGVRDHLQDGKNGLAYPECDAGAMAAAMVKLAEDWALTQRLSRGARRTGEGLTWERELDRLDLSYREVCEATTRGSWGVALEAGNQQVTVVPTPRSLSA